MKGLVALVLSVALVDSLNPSTMGPAVYLATRKHAARSLLGFTLGVFAVNVAAGLVLTLGPGQAILAAVPTWESTPSTCSRSSSAWRLSHSGVCFGPSATASPTRSYPRSLSDMAPRLHWERES